MKIFRLAYLYQREELSLSTLVSHEVADNKKVNWSSSNTKVAEVDEADNRVTFTGYDPSNKNKIK